MRFQTTKRIQGLNPELVLGALEGCLRSVSSEVIRQGNQITLLGLGPSPRAINRRDTTVIEVEHEDGGTLIHADVRFQASAFLGMAAQDVVVQEKLDRIFNDLLAQLGCSGLQSDTGKSDRPEPANPVVTDLEEVVPKEADLPIAEETAPEPADTGIPITVPGLQPLGVSETPADDRAEVAASPETEMLVAETSAPAEEAVRSASMIGSEPGEAAPESSTNTLDLSTTALESPIPEAVRAVEVPVAAIPQPAPPKSSELPAGRLEEPAKFASAPAEPRRTLPQRPESAAIITPKPPEQPLQSPLSAKVSAPVASGTRSLTKTPVPPKTQEPAKEMFGLSAFDEPDTSSRWLKWSAWIAALIVLVIAPLVWLYMPSHPESEAAPTAQPATAAAPAEPVATPKQPGEDPDPAMVLKDWAAAMNSRDAAAQAAFYANPVERYFLRHNLSRDEVKADKQAAIDRRKGDWAVKMESIKVSRPDDKTAKARLIKHYTVKEEGKTASEWFVPSALQMTRTNGRWQITSERDLGWGTSLEELGY